MSQIFDGVIPMLLPKLSAAMDLAAQTVVEDIESTLDTPLPAHQPGDSYSHPSDTPYLRTGRLYVGVRHFQEQDDFAITERIVSSRATDDGHSENVPSMLEFGSIENAPYPFMRPAKDRAAEMLVPIVAAGVSLNA